VVVVLLSAVSLPASSGPSTGATAAVPRTLSVPFNGRVDQRDGFSALLVSVSGNAGATGDTALRIDLLQTREGIDSALQLRFPDGADCTGTVSAIDRSGFSGSCTTPRGAARHVEGSWSVTGEQVAGTIDVTAESPSNSGALGV
jgi:hypothetical protein